MNLLKTCSKCKTRYLFFHLKQDCKFIELRYEALKALLTKHSLDKQLGNPIKVEVLKEILNRIINTSRELDERATFWEYTRIASAPFLMFATSIIIGLITSHLANNVSIIDFLTLLALIAYFIWGLFLYQGGFNLIFKRIMLSDLLKRYHIK